MQNELRIRKRTEPLSAWIDIWSTYGFRLTDESKDLFKSGKVVAYNYQFVNSNERQHIVIKDANDKVVRECATINLSFYTDKDYVKGKFSTIEDAWDSFKDYISDGVIEIKSIISGVSNFYTLEGELNPTPTIGFDGKWEYLTCGIQFKQIIAK